MTEKEYEKIRDGLLWIIESGETKEAAKATASLLQLEEARLRTRLRAELDENELDGDETEEEEEEYDEEDYGRDAAGDC